MSYEPAPLGDILQDIGRKLKRAKKSMSLARRAEAALVPVIGGTGVNVRSFKVGVLVIEVETPVCFQEIEGFQRERILNAIRAAGMPVSTLRVQMKKGG